MYPSNGFYLQTIFFEQGDLNNTAFYNKVIEVADSVNALVATGYAEWKTLKQAYTLWETVHAAQMFQWECGAIFTDVPDHSKEIKVILYPNPMNRTATLEFTNLQNPPYELKFFDLIGREAGKHEINNEKTEILRRDLPVGMYFYQVIDGNNLISTGKLIIQ